jgi:hypothetical protein
MCVLLSTPRPQQEYFVRHKLAKTEKAHDNIIFFFFFF